MKVSKIGRSVNGGDTTLAGSGDDYGYEAIGFSCTRGRGGKVAGTGGAGAAGAGAAETATAAGATAGGGEGGGTPEGPAALAA